jgi:hypothetical protein
LFLRKKPPCTPIIRTSQNSEIAVSMPRIGAKVIYSEILKLVAACNFGCIEGSNPAPNSKKSVGLCPRSLLRFDDFVG